jgi:hypothetical protein
MDANNATNAAIIEVDRMRRIRKLLMRELEEKNADTQPTEATTTKE